MSRRGLAAVASVLDQAASSATNILVLVLAARLSSAAGFADFSMVYVTFTVLLGLNVAYVGQTLVLEKDDPASARLATACRSGLAFSGAASAAVGAVLALLGLLLPGATGWSFLALGLVLPLVLLQDGLRYCFSALRAPDGRWPPTRCASPAWCPRCSSSPRAPRRGGWCWCGGSPRCPRSRWACGCCGPRCGAAPAAPSTYARTCGAGTWDSGSWSSSPWATAPASSPSWGSASSRPRWPSARCAVPPPSSGR